MHLRVPSEINYGGVMRERPSLGTKPPWDVPGANGSSRRKQTLAVEALVDPHRPTPER